jgi:hypothetical protein
MMQHKLDTGKVSGLVGLVDEKVIENSVWSFRTLVHSIQFPEIESMQKANLAKICDILQHAGVPDASCTSAELIVPF